MFQESSGDPIQALEMFRNRSKEGVGIPTQKVREAVSYTHLTLPTIYSV